MVKHNTPKHSTFPIEALFCPCGSNFPSSCASTNLAGVTWTISGDLSGIDTEGFFTKNGYLHAEDLDEVVCWVSPTINIGSVANSSVNVTFSIPAGATWETSTTVGSLDYLDVKYAADGGAFVTIPNVNGCPSSGHTLSAASCASNIVGPQTFNISESGIVGELLDIQVCIDINAASDDGHLEEVSVPESGITLPVVWTSINVQKTKSGNLIKWSTAGEINNDRYEVQRLDDLTADYVAIGGLTAQGTTFGSNNYEYIDHYSASGAVVYYRIMQVDFDGKRSYSKSVSLENTNEESTELSVYRNPVSSTVRITKSGTGQIDNLVVYNQYGQSIDNIVKPFLASSQFDYDVTALDAGIYTVRAVGQHNTELHKSIRFCKI